MIERTRAKGRISSQVRWWVSEWIAEDCKSTGLNPEGEEVMMGWQRWLRSNKRDDEKQDRDAKHERLVQKMTDSAGGGACFLLKIT